MMDLQKEVERFCKENQLEAPTVYRLLDLVSELGEVAKEILKGSDYGKNEIKLAPRIILKTEPLFLGSDVI